MWVQQLNELGLISMNKLGTLENVADMMTKHVPRGVLDKLAGMMGYSFPGEETARFREYSSIEQSYWNQKTHNVGLLRQCLLHCQHVGLWSQISHVCR